MGGQLSSQNISTITSVSAGTGISVSSSAGVATITAAGVPIAETALGALTWTAGTPPSGTISKTYRAFTIGSCIHFYAKITASVAGVAVTAVSFPLPAAVANPVLWAVQESSGLVIPGSGSMQTVVTGSVNGSAGIYEDGAGGYVVKVFSAAAATAEVYCFVTWLSS